MAESIIEAQERLEENHLGKHDGRIRHPSELLDLKGETIWVVSCPADLSDEENIKYMGTSFLVKMVVGDILTPSGKVVESSRQLPRTVGDNVLYLVHAGDTYSSNDGKEEHLIISLKDYNVIPNNASNLSGLFTSEQAAQKFRMFIRMKWPINALLEKIDGSRCINGLKVHLPTIQETGIKFTSVP